MIKIKCTFLLIITVMAAFHSATAGTWGVMNFDVDKWGATPDAYEVTSIENGYNAGEIIVSFSLNGIVFDDSLSKATLFTITCGDVTVVSTSSPVTITGLDVGETYSCTVTASNDAGSSSASAEVTITPEDVIYPSNILMIISAKKRLESK